MGRGVRRLSWRFVLSSPLTSKAARARHTITKPVLEPLEGRQLLALFTGFSHVRNIPTPTGVYYPGTEEAHTNPTRQRGECLRALAGASG